MIHFATVLLIIATATWVGAIMFQSAIVAPSVFSQLDEASARRFLRSLFPRFFRLGAVSSAVALVAAATAGALADWPPRGLLLIALSAAMLALSVIALAMIPSINAARDAGSAGAARFSTLHRLNVLATIGMLALGLAILTTIGLSTFPA
jgi:uncharacterized membrane protein